MQENVQCFIDDIWKWQIVSPHKKIQGASGKALGRKVSNYLLQILKQKSITV